MAINQRRHKTSPHLPPKFLLAYILIYLLVVLVFDLLAKEGRKYSLSMCIATQRPSDIPEGVLSQIGTLLVHRLTNERDRHVVEQASDELDRSAAEFLPTLAPGQAVLIGVAFPIPLTLQILPPNAPPDSKGPRFQDQWAHAEDE